MCYPTDQLAPATTATHVTWSPPPLDCFKINYDGTVFIQVNKSSICVIIRNNQELVIAALAQQLSQAYQAMEIEATDVVRALEFGLEVGVDRVLMEGDCKIVVKTLVEDNPSLAFSQAAD